MDVFRIGLIGAGSIGTRHIKAIDELALMELVAIADPAPAAAKLAESAALRLLLMLRACSQRQMLMQLSLPPQRSVTMLI